MEQTLGKRIAQYRKNMKLTQDQLAEQLGITAQAVSKWENDLSCPDITMLPRLAAIFGVTTDQLLGVKPQQEAVEAEVVDGNKGDLHVDIGAKNNKWEFRWDAGRKSSVIFALLVLLVGGLLVTARIFQWNVSFWQILWPSAILMLGIHTLLGKFSGFGVGMTLLGGYFLVDNLGILEFHIGSELLFPIAVVLFGMSLLLDALKKPKKSRFTLSHNGEQHNVSRSQVTEDDGFFTIDQAFCENSHNVEMALLNGGNIDTAFGSLTVDLGGCQAVAGNCVIHADCSFGELTILVPKKFRVEPSSDTSFASVDVTGRPDSEAVGVIRLNADVSFGHIDIEYV